MDDTFTDFLEHPPPPYRMAVYGESGKNGCFERLYVTKCCVSKTYFYGSIFDNCRLSKCTLVNCILTSGPKSWAYECEFQNCQIRGTADALYDLDECTFSNCKIEYGWNNECRSLKDREPKDLIATQNATYEVFGNVLLKEIVVDYLRHWAWRTKRRLRVPAIYGPPLPPEMQKARDSGCSMDGSSDSDSAMGAYTISPSKSDSSWCQILPTRDGSQFKDATLPPKIVPVDHTDKDILKVWSAKKAGKRPFHVNDSYYVEQQLQLPLARSIMWDGTRARRRPWKFAETYGGDMRAQEVVDTSLAMEMLID
ncbi:hypothetical protein BLS_003777 [Venturia inaequalis]|uniref:Uncharacterized protein n=1 Tax=Venturia inaequalis TaxID=5025 RepID=A0A8H3UMW2_VENIN|nr:hypothetical protein BLS_003777 [Venturia inaequalis]